MTARLEDGGAGATPRAAVETVRFPVQGMTCTSCVNRITRALRGVEGVERVRVNLGSETATIRRDAARVSDESVTATVAAAGYVARMDLAEVLPTSGEPTMLDRLIAWRRDRRRRSADSGKVGR